MLRCIVECVDKPSLGQAQLKRTEFSWQKSHNIDGGGWRNDDALDTMNNTIGPKLKREISLCYTNRYIDVLTMLMAIIRS